jgi:hypothetical protein
MRLCIHHLLMAPFAIYNSNLRHRARPRLAYSVLAFRNATELGAHAGHVSARH